MMLVVGWDGTIELVDVVPMSLYSVNAEDPVERLSLVAGVVVVSLF